MAAVEASPTLLGHRVQRHLVQLEGLVERPSSAGSGDPERPGQLPNRPAEGHQVLGRRGQLPCWLSPTAHLDVDPAVLAGLASQPVAEPVDLHLQRPVPHDPTSPTLARPRIRRPRDSG
jgi:hypothetical protein